MRAFLSVWTKKFGGTEENDQRDRDVVVAVGNERAR